MGSRTFCFFLLALCATLASASGSLRRDSFECDSCNTLVEEFHKQWVVVIKDQTQKARAESGNGDKPPSITYNQDIEDMVQGFCKSKEYRQYSADMRAGCDDIMKDHLREIVGKFLHQEMNSDLSHAKGVPQRKKEVCAEMTKSCPDVDVSKGLSQCGACRALMRDVNYVYRRSHPAKRVESLRIWEMFEPICEEVQLRHEGKQAKQVAKICDKVFSDFDEDVVDLFRVKMNPDQITDAVCSELINACPNAKLEEERKRAEKKEEENPQQHSEMNVRTINKGIV